MKKTDFEFKYVGRCIVCGSEFLSRNVFLLERLKDISEVYAECSKCKSSVFIHIVTNKDTVNVVPILTDMSKEDIKKFRNMEPITEQEVKTLDDR